MKPMKTFSHKTFFHVRKHAKHLSLYDHAQNGHLSFFSFLKFFSLAKTFFSIGDLCVFHLRKDVKKIVSCVKTFFLRIIFFFYMSETKTSFFPMLLKDFFIFSKKVVLSCVKTCKNIVFTLEYFSIYSWNQIKSCVKKQHWTLFSLIHETQNGNILWKNFYFLGYGSEKNLKTFISLYGRNFFFLLHHNQLFSFYFHLWKHTRTFSIFENT